MNTIDLQSQEDLRRWLGVGGEDAERFALLALERHTVFSHHWTADDGRVWGFKSVERESGLGDVRPLISHFEAEVQMDRATVRLSYSIDRSLPLERGTVWAWHVQEIRGW